MWSKNLCKSSMTTKLNHYLVFLFIVLLHLAWLYVIREQVAPELLFQEWLLTSSKKFVSDIHTMYPLGLFYLIKLAFLLTENLRLSFYTVHICIVLFLDSLLYFYLKKQFGFKNAFLGLIFYVIWQVFLRGNYLWFDLATIPLIALSYFHFSDFTEKLRQKDLIYASIFLSLGIFFKNTISWILIFYLLWLIVLAFGKKLKPIRVITNACVLILPITTTITINFLLLAAKSSLAFSFYWSIVCAYLIFPRLTNFSRFATPNYYPILGVLAAFYLISCWAILKYSPKTKYQKWFVCTFPLATIASIFPRWSDFRLQLFVFFLAMLFTYTLSLYKLLSTRDRFIFNVSLLVLFSLTFAFVANRAYIENQSSKVLMSDGVSKYQKNILTAKIHNKSVLAYDGLFYNYDLVNEATEQNVASQSKLIITSPDLFFHNTSPNAVLSFAEKTKPDYVVVHKQMHSRIVSNHGLTSFEKFVSGNYSYDATADDLYFFYSQKQNTPINR